jgi:hypothetical protein
MYMPDLGDVKWNGGLLGERFEVCRDDHGAAPVGFLSDAEDEPCLGELPDRGGTREG